MSTGLMPDGYERSRPANRGGAGRGGKRRTGQSCWYGSPRLGVSRWTGSLRCGSGSRTGSAWTGLVRRAGPAWRVVGSLLGRGGPATGSRSGVVRRRVVAQVRVGLDRLVAWASQRCGSAGLVAPGRLGLACHFVLACRATGSHSEQLRHGSASRREWARYGTASRLVVTREGQSRRVGSAWNVPEEWHGKKRPVASGRIGAECLLGGAGEGLGWLVTRDRKAEAWDVSLTSVVAGRIVARGGRERAWHVAMAWAALTGHGSSPRVGSAWHVAGAGHDQGRHVAWEGFVRYREGASQWTGQRRHVTPGRRGGNRPGPSRRLGL